MSEKLYSKLFNTIQALSLSLAIITTTQAQVYSTMTKDSMSYQKESKNNGTHTINNDSLNNILEYLEKDSDYNFVIKNILHLENAIQKIINDTSSTREKMSQEIINIKDVYIKPIQIYMNDNNKSKVNQEPMEKQINKRIIENFSRIKSDIVSYNTENNLNRNIDEILCANQKILSPGEFRNKYQIDQGEGEEETRKQTFLYGMYEKIYLYKHTKWPNKQEKTQAQKNIQKYYETLKLILQRDQKMIENLEKVRNNNKEILKNNFTE